MGVMPSDVRSLKTQFIDEEAGEKKANGRTRSGEDGVQVKMTGKKRSSDVKTGNDNGSERATHRKRRKGGKASEESVEEASKNDGSESEVDPEDLEEHRLKKRTKARGARLRRKGLDELSDLEEAVGAREANFFDVADDCADDNAWRKGIEELRRRKKAEEAKEEKFVFGDGVNYRFELEEVTAMIRAAIAAGSWARVTAMQPCPKPLFMISVIMELHDHEVLALIRGVSERYETHPREQRLSYQWLHQALAHRSLPLVGRRELRDACRPLITKLSNRHRASRGGGQVWACMGKWKLVRSMVAARQRVLQDNKELVADPDADEESGEDDSLEDEKNEDDEDDKAPGNESDES